MERDEDIASPPVVFLPLSAAAATYLWACGEVGRGDAAATEPRRDDKCVFPRVAIVNRRCEARELDPKMRLAKERGGRRGMSLHPYFCWNYLFI